MITFILISLCILSSGFTGNIYKKLSEKSRSVAVSSLMPALWFLILGIFFSALFFVSGEEIPYSLIWVSLLSGICIFAAAFILIESMKVSSLSISVILVNLNFIIPVVLSQIFLNEKASSIQIGGLVISAAMIVILNAAPIGGGSLKWAVFIPLAASLANGLVNFCIKVNENHKGDTNFFFAIMYLSASFASFVTYLILKHASKKTNSDIPLKDCLGFMLLMAICNGVCFYTSSLLASRMNAAAQFTIITSASIFLSITVGVIFQKEKISFKSILSMLLCTVAIICQCIGIMNG